MECEQEADNGFPGRQWLANALDLDSRLNQRELTNQQRQFKQSTLINALCEDTRTQDNEQEQEDFGNDWKRFLVRLFPFIIF